MARRPAVLAALSYVVLALLILGPSIRPGRTVVPADLLGPRPPYPQLTLEHAQNPILSDAADQFYPWVVFVGGSLRHGDLPQWNPQLLGGVRATPNGYVNTYYPATWLGRWLAPFDLYNVFVFVHLVVAALGVYVLSRVLGSRPAAAWVAGILAFAADFWIHWSLHLVHLVGFALMPWALAAAHVAVTRPSRRSASALALVVGLWLLGGNPQYVYFGLLATGGYAVLRIVRDRVLDRRPIVRPVIAIAGGMTLGVAIAAVVVVPGLATRPEIVRAREGPEAMAGTIVPLGEAVRLLVPDATGNPPDHVDIAPNPEFQMDSPFVGVTTVLLVGAAVAARRARLLLLAGAGTVLVLAFTGPPNRLLYDVVPGYDGFRAASRWLSVLPVFALPAAALGLDSLLTRERWSRQAVAITAGLSLSVLGVWYLRHRTTHGVPGGYFGHRALFAGFIVALVVLAAIVVRRSPRLTVALVCACALAEVLVHTPRWYPSVKEATAYPPVPVAAIARANGGRIIHVAPGERANFTSFEADVPMAYGLADVQGWTVFFPKRVDRYLRLIDDYGAYAIPNSLAPALSDPGQVGSPLVGALDARTVVSSVAINSPSLTAAGTDPFTYTRHTFGPAWLVPRAVATNESGMWAEIARPNWAPDQVAYVQGLGRDVAGGVGTVRGGLRNSDNERWNVDAPQGGFLVVSGAYDVGWRAMLDGHDTKVSAVDGLFRGVAVPRGRHIVDFRFTNPDERRGRLLSGVALVVVVALASSPAWRRRSRVRRATAV